MKQLTRLTSDNHHSAFPCCEFDYSKCLAEVGSYDICLCRLTYLTQRNGCKVHVCGHVWQRLPSDTESHSTVCKNYILISHSSVSRHVGCFQVLDIVNNVALNVGVQCFFKSLHSIFLAMYAEVKLLYQMVILFLIC